MTINETMTPQDNSDSFFHLVNASGANAASDGSLNKPFDNESSDNEVKQQVIDYYHNTLKNTPTILSALQKMGIDKSEAIDTFKLGFSDRTFGNLLPEKNRKEGMAKRGLLQRIGILKASGHELFRGSLVVPVIENGFVHQMYGHKVAKKLRPGTPIDTALYDSLPNLFNIKVVHTCEELILCSSILDALTFWCAGYKNVTCSDGVGYLPNNIIELFNDSPVKRVLIAYAGTKKADAAGIKLAKQLTTLDIECYRIEFNKNRDANTYALNNLPSSDSLGEVIRKAVWLSGSKPPDKLATNTESTDKSSECVSSNPEPDLNLQNYSSGESTVEKEPIEKKESPHDEMVGATVIPQPAVEVKAEVKDNVIVMCFSNRRYRIRGLEHNTVSNHLKVNILVNRKEVLHIDTFDLYSARHRDNFCKQSSIELGISEEVFKKDLSQILLKLELLQDENISQILTPNVLDNVLTPLEHAEAMHFLRSPNLKHRILEDFQRCGIVGEKNNSLVAYFACVSRLLPSPIAVMIQSSSAAGKSVLMDVTLSFVPVTQRVQYSAITGQSLFYMGDINVKHKVFSVSEEEGISAAAYALKLLISEGQLTIASTGKDPDTGRHVTREYKVEGPVMLFSTTTAIDIDEELLNRCFVLTVDEDRAQTRAIHDLQRFEETLEGLKVSQIKEDVIRVQQNAQSLLKPLKVVNPFAKQLTFLDDKTRTRRDHKKYLTLINSIALLHQYQRKIKKVYCNGKQISYVEVMLEDIDLANQLAHKVLGSSLDELPPQTRRLLMLIDKMITTHCEDKNIPRSDYRFSRRDVRAYTGWGDTQLKVHIKRLENMEYLLIHRGGRGRQFIYELLYNHEGQNGDAFLMGLVDIETLKKQVNDDNKSGLKANLSGLSRSQVDALSGTCHAPKNAPKPHDNKVSDENSLLSEKDIKALIEKNTPQASYPKSNSSNINGGLPQ